QVWRIKYHDRKRLVCKRQRAEVGNEVWTDNQATTIAQGMRFGADISEHGAGVPLVEPEHAGAAAHV
ncbi:TPA: hypothetical protein O5C65_005060, partial [Salmonella enterica subsp. enterica serovar Mokola]|nr:hypothetical protein [Salmonella enterica subsp. enterica serovar Mokola]